MRVSVRAQANRRAVALEQLNDIADFDADGWLDVFLPGYHHGDTREGVAAHLFWGGPDGFDDLRQTELMQDGGHGAMAADFNGDGRLDLAISCHTRNGTHETESLVCWGEGALQELAGAAAGRVMLVTRSRSKAIRKIVTIGPDGVPRREKPFFHDQLREPRCMASIVSHPAHPDALLFSCPPMLPKEPGGKRARENLAIQLSRDDGKTRPVTCMLDPGRGAYSDLAVLPDGNVVCPYEAATGLAAARFNLEWVTQ